MQDYPLGSDEETLRAVSDADLVLAYQEALGDHYAAARTLGIAPYIIFRRIREMEVRPEMCGVTYVVPTQRTPQRIGRPNLQKYIVSIRYVGDDGWSLFDREAIEEARRRYDRGEVEMFQGREGMWVILYMKQRRHRDARRERWFNPKHIGAN